jgi:hypothetical protein
MHAHGNHFGSFKNILMLFPSPKTLIHSAGVCQASEPCGSLEATEVFRLGSFSWPSDDEETLVGWMDE